MVSVVRKSRSYDQLGRIFKVLSTRFGPSQYEDPTALLPKFQQTNLVEEYQTQFEELANCTKGLNDSFMVSCFVGGLKEEICPSVQMLKPATLTNAVGLARMQEEKVLARRRQAQPDLEIVAPNSSMGNKKFLPTTIKRLSPIEMKVRRDKGLCYNCDEKFAPGHLYKVHKLFLMDGCWLDDGIEDECANTENGEDAKPWG